LLRSGSREQVINLIALLQIMSSWIGAIALFSKMDGTEASGVSMQNGAHGKM